MKPKTTYDKDPETGQWSFIITNTKTRTLSSGYSTKLQAKEAVKDIQDGLKPYKKSLKP
jgi:hypothetical protein